MNLLRIDHSDFTLFIESRNFNTVLGKAKSNIPADSLTARYTRSAGVEKVVFYEESNEIILEQDKPSHALFFDNADYSVWVDFGIEVKSVRLLSIRQDDQEHFSFHELKQVFSGYLNFGNDIGLADFKFEYVLSSGEKRIFALGFEVLSTKLDYHKHWQVIIKDIEDEYRMLSLDYLKRTCHSFGEGSGNSFDLIWWNVFQSVQKEFIQACKNIIERPRHRLRSHQVYMRADQIRHFTPLLEQEFAEHRMEPERLYMVQESENSNNTLENRFLKHTLKFVSEKFDELLKRILQFNQLSETQKDEFKEQNRMLQHLVRNPFFRTIGNFEGLKQESLVLQNETNYSKIYRDNILLRKSFSLNEGMYRMQTKDIATLYEIWCFIQVSHIVKDLMGENALVTHANRMEMSNNFVYELGRGEYSKILFEKDGVRLAELIYNPKTNDKVFEDDESLSIRNLITPTVPQKPDIVLQLTKNDIEQQMKMTYLFDAKYRLSGKEKGIDTPPDDAINQMHRYRDAIYYQYGGGELKKEVIGGYILFPGNGERTEVEMSKYYTSINEVNIGAFPLRPGSDESRQLLVDFIANLLEKKAKTIVTEVIPQKGTVVSVRDRVLVGIVKHEEQVFENGTATLYYSGKNFPTTIPLDGLHYFAPYIKGKGIRDLYEITKIRTITSREAKDDDSEGNDLRLAFELGNCQQLYNEYHPHELKVKYSFTDTTIEELK